MVEYVKGAGIDGIILDVECGAGSITGDNLTRVRDGFTGGKSEE